MSQPKSVVLNLYAFRLGAIRSELEGTRAELHWMGVYGNQGPDLAAHVCAALQFPP